MNVTATELKHRLGHYLDAAISEPVVIEKNGRQTAVILSYVDYERLTALEDAYWGNLALEAKKEGDVKNGLEELARIAHEKGIDVAQAA
ncbi:MAG: type II toxin-antitoxin system Phd/YefM family antitoxin [Gammaproteobacteria bacterium]|nr:type II toxin-antitoxin system Phd/YefM family antitoxin [Gammaproteobacteria bacterium]